MKCLLTAFFILATSLSFGEIVTVYFKGTVNATDEELENLDFPHRDFEGELSFDSSITPLQITEDSHHCISSGIFSESAAIYFDGVKGNIFNSAVSFDDGPIDSYYINFIFFFSTDESNKFNSIKFAVGFPMLDGYGKRCNPSNYIDLTDGHTNFDHHARYPIPFYIDGVQVGTSSVEVDIDMEYITTVKP